MLWRAVRGQLAVEESKIQGWIQTQSPHSPAAGSTSFALLVWLGMNGTGLVFFQTGCTLPHYKLYHVLSFPLPYLPISFSPECKRGAFAGSCSELRGQAKMTLSPAWCFSFRLRGGDVLRICKRKHWKGRKGTKREGKKSTARKLETNFKLWIVSHPGSN